MIRINRFLAGCGLGSRRKCESYVLEGKVSVNGSRIDSLSYGVDPSRDKVSVNGREVSYVESTMVLALNKPAGIICSVSDERGRRTVIDIAREEGFEQRLYPVGRLDKDTTGIILITDDGELTNRLTHPRYHVAKVYLVRARGRVSEDTAAAIEEGVDIGGYITGPCRLRILAANDRWTDMEITLKEGKKRQVKRMFLSCGHSVIKLHRKSIGGLDFGDLETGEVRPLSDEEENHLRRKVGLE